MGHPIVHCLSTSFWVASLTPSYRNAQFSLVCMVCFSISFYSPSQYPLYYIFLCNLSNCRGLQLSITLPRLFHGRYILFGRSRNSIHQQCNCLTGMELELIRTVIMEMVGFMPLRRKGSLNCKYLFILDLLFRQSSNECEGKMK